LEGYVREVMKSFSREIKSESRDFALEQFNSLKIIGGIENFARNRPVIFLGAALTAGVLIRQFSSASQNKLIPRRSDCEDASSAEQAAGKGEEYYERH
jgi:hypothetical protein